MTRKDFLSAIPLLAAPAGAAAASIRNRAFEVSVSGAEVRVVDRAGGVVLASGPYSYALPAPVSMRFAVSGETITLTGSPFLHVDVTQTIHVPQGKPWIEETFVVRNRGLQPVALGNPRCGFVLPVKLDGSSVAGPLRDYKFTAIPYRREPSGDRSQYADYTIAQVLLEPRVSHLRSQLGISRSGPVTYPNIVAHGLLQSESWAYASEGWCLTDGRRGLVHLQIQPGRHGVGGPRPCTAWMRGGDRPCGGVASGIYFGDPEHGRPAGAGVRSHHLRRQRASRLSRAASTKASTPSAARWKPAASGCPAGLTIRAVPLERNLRQQALVDSATAGPTIRRIRKKYYTAG